MINDHTALDLLHADREFAAFLPLQVGMTAVAAAVLAFHAIMDK